MMSDWLRLAWAAALAVIVVLHGWHTVAMGGQGNGCDDADSRASRQRLRRGHCPPVKRRRRRLLDTTNSDDIAMAAPAISGLSRPSAAIGSAAML